MFLSKKMIVFSMMLAFCCSMARGMGSMKITPGMLMKEECPCMLVGTEEEAAATCPAGCSVSESSTEDGKRSGYICCKIPSGEGQTTVRKSAVQAETSGHQVVEKTMSHRVCSVVRFSCVLRLCRRFGSFVVCRYFLGVCTAVSCS